MPFILPFALAAFIVTEGAAVFYVLDRSTKKTRADMERALEGERAKLRAATDRRDRSAQTLRAITQELAGPTALLCRSLERLDETIDLSGPLQDLVDSSSRLAHLTTLASELVQAERSDEHSPLRPVDLYQIMAQTEHQARVELALVFPEEIHVQVPPGAAIKALGRLVKLVAHRAGGMSLKIIAAKEGAFARLQVYHPNRGNLCVIPPRESLEALAARRSMERAGGSIQWGKGTEAAILTILLPLAAEELGRVASGPLRVVSLEA